MAGRWGPCGHQHRVEFRRNGPVLRSRQWTPAMETDLPVARGSDELGVERAHKRSKFWEECWSDAIWNLLPNSLKKKIVVRTSVWAKYFAIYHCTERQAVKSRSEMFPNFSVAVYAETLVVKPIHLDQRKIIRVWTATKRWRYSFSKQFWREISWTDGRVAGTYTCVICRHSWLPRVIVMRCGNLTFRHSKIETVSWQGNGLENVNGCQGCRDAFFSCAAA